MGNNKSIINNNNNNNNITIPSTLIEASKNGHLAIVERLLQDPRVDPSAQNNFAIAIASMNGHLAVVERLLEDPRVDPSAKNNCAIRWAAYSNHLAIVERLLQDARVEPTRAFRISIFYLNIPIIILFMNDKRINIMSNLQDIVLCISMSKSLIVLDMLIQDNRIDLLILHDMQTFNRAILENIQFKKLSYATRLLICGKLLLKDFPKNSNINHWKKDMQKCKDELAKCRKTMYGVCHLDNEIFDEYILMYLCNNNAHNLEIQYMT
jgi:hypothetical protein